MGQTLLLPGCWKLTGLAPQHMLLLLLTGTCCVAQQAMHLSTMQRQHLLEMRSALFAQMEGIVQQRRRIIAELEVGTLNA